MTFQLHLGWVRMGSETEKGLSNHIPIATLEAGLKQKGSQDRARSDLGRKVDRRPSSLQLQKLPIRFFLLSSGPHNPLTDNSRGLNIKNGLPRLLLMPRLKPCSVSSQQASPWLSSFPSLSLCFLLQPGYPASQDSSFQGTDTDSSGAPLLQVYC